MNSPNTSPLPPAGAPSTPGLVPAFLRGSRKLAVGIGVGVALLVALALGGCWLFSGSGGPRVMRQYASPNYSYECQVLIAPGSFWGGTQDRFTFSIYPRGNSLALNGTLRSFTAAKVPPIEVMWLSNSDVRAFAGADQPVFLGRIEDNGSQSWRPDVAPEQPSATPQPHVEKPAAPAPTPAPAPVQTPSSGASPAPVTAPAGSGN